jgi:hypothetical protein
MEKITVITCTIPRPSKRILKFAARLLEKILKIKLCKKCPKYGCHPDVTRSLVEGLQQLKADFNYNPQNLKDLGKTVIVLCGVKQLQQMIDFKKRGIIKNLLAGPNLAVVATEYNKILTNPEINICLTPSEWVKDIYELDCPEIRGRVKSWPAGVNTEYWNPCNKKKDPKNILFYNKRSEKNLFENCKEYCKKRGYNIEVINYGFYKIEGYKEALERNSFVIHFVEQESQGICLAESWAMDVPTIVWNPVYFRWGLKNYQACSAPYLSQKTGAFFHDFEEFKKIEQAGAFETQKYSAREWTLENLSDKLSAKKILEIIKDI